MKKYILIIAVLCITSSCRTRQVNTGKISVADKSTIAQTIKNDVLQIDTGKITTHNQSTQSVKDSIEIDIIPDTGSIQIVNGNYTGKTRSIKITSTSASVQAINNLIQQNKGEITQSTLNDSIIRKNNIQTTVKTKQVTAKGPDQLWLWLAGILLVLAICFMAFKKYILALKVF